MATRKTAATEKPARTRATGAKPAGATRAAAAKAGTKKAGTTTKKAPARKAASTTTARKAPTRGKAAAGTAAKAKAGKPSARASKKAVTASRASRARTGAAVQEHAPSFEAAQIAAKAALDKKAENVVILDVRGLTSYADYFVVASGTSDRQVSAIADAIEEQMKKAGHRTIGVEGYTRGHWVLLDFGDVVAHVFYEEARAFYDIEGLWADARRIPME